MISDRIFVQIAAYRDFELIPTVKDALAQALCPERISFGICWQYGNDEELHFIDGLKDIPNCRVATVPAAESCGLGWARSQTEKLWQGERYALQTDAHMRFATGWDTLLIEMLAMCPSQKPVLTAFPPGYHPPRVIVSNFPTGTATGRFAHNGMMTPRAVEDLSNYHAPKSGAFMAGGFMFADARLMQEVPHDPLLYFSATEVAYSVRAWTNGWDIYHPHRVTCWHYYYDIQEKPRPLNWEDNQDWYQRHTISEQRFRQILQMEPMTEDFGIYGLGNVRSLTDYEAFAGVSFRNWQQYIKDEQQRAMQLLSGCLQVYSSSYLLVIQSEPHPAFANANAPLPASGEGLGVGLKCTSSNREPLYFDETVSDRLKSLLNDDKDYSRLVQIDWQYFIKVASELGVLSLVYWSLNKTAPHLVPESTLRELQQYYYANALRNRSHSQVLLHLLNQLAAAQVTAIPINEPALAALVDGDLSFWQFQTLDLWIAASDRATATEILTAAGYQPGEIWQIGQQSFTHPQRAVKIELHWQLLGWEWQKERLCKVELENHTIQTLPPRDYLLLLCLSAAKIGWERSLLKVYQIAALIARYPSQPWDDLLQQAEQMTAKEALLTGIWLAHKCFKIVLPAAVIQSLETMPEVSTITIPWLGASES
ncbi:nucleotidyltransferase family protein [Nostoc spongiaeforme FACHB-130]|uniref:Nucleotidyltransferase family protein n=1 Tax=Nostoc spongiaeforme FACHB-130 TaxID=1357510 RepID=A0ABR8FTE4_9NOSO|nr:GlcNAc-transferase family protein [Nostoc spongiaeforme]MBD2593502.1 nucleotidyltransferase family protein [Nostoc spongiaeforme FACHB-130]